MGFPTGLSGDRNGWYHALEERFLSQSIITFLRGSCTTISYRGSMFIKQFFVTGTYISVKFPTETYHYQMHGLSLGIHTWGPLHCIVLLIADIGASNFKDFKFENQRVPRKNFGVITSDKLLPRWYSTLVRSSVSTARISEPWLMKFIGNILKLDGSRGSFEVL